jgi:hypothetical protein
MVLFNDNEPKTSYPFFDCKLNNRIYLIFKNVEDIMKQRDSLVATG